MDLFDDIQDIYAGDEDWWESPVTFREFVTSREHMNHPGLTDRQYKMFESFVGTNPKEVFHNLKKTPHDKRRKKHVKVLRLAKGSGKDLAASMFQNYLFYLTLCMQSPTKYFDFPSVEEHLDIVNVAQSQTQATKVFFKRFTTRIKNWVWARQHFLLVDHGRPLNPSVLNPKHTIKILDASLECSNSVNFTSLHTSSQGFEGLNIIAFTMDEPSAFQEYEQFDKDGRCIIRSKADDIYDVLRTSASSRNVEWLGVMIAYPRRADCFITRMYNYAVEHPDSDVCGETGLQWDYLPKSKFSGEWVIWEGYRIPKEKLEDAKTDPESFKIKYLCVTDKSTGKFFQLNDYKPCLIRDMEQLAQFSDELITSPTGRTYLYKSLDFWKNVREDVEYCLAADYSKIGDRTVLGIGHAETPAQRFKAYTEYDKLVVIDLLLIWQPDKKRNVLVSHSSIKECLAEIKYRLDIRHATLDQLESALTIETFNMDGIPCDLHNVNDDDYLRLRNVCRAGLLRVPYSDLLDSEFQCVQFYQRRGHHGRVDHPADGSKDVLDVLCNITRQLYKFNLSPSLEMAQISHSTKSVAERIIDANTTPQIAGSLQEETINPDDWSNLLDPYLI